LGSDQILIIKLWPIFGFFATSGIDPNFDVNGVSGCIVHNNIRSGLGFLKGI
jgi:hypothetical protein